MKWRHLKDQMEAMSAEELDKTASFFVPAYRREFKLATLCDRKDAELAGEGRVLVTEFEAVQ